MENIEKCCNICGRKVKISGIDREDLLLIDKNWGYFSAKDGERHCITMCESCYDLWITSFKIPPHVEEITEMI